MYCVGYVQYTSLSSATSLNTDKISLKADVAVVIAEAQAVRWRTDANPTSSVGMPLAVGVSFEVDSTDLTNIKFIEQTSGAKLNVAFFKRGLS